LPKLANPGVLRRALAEGVEKGLFGLAIPRETLNLVTPEGLRQLGLTEVDVTIHDKG